MGKPKAEQMYSGMADCFGKILKTEGPGGFFKGALANVLRGTGAALVLERFSRQRDQVDSSKERSPTSFVELVPPLFWKDSQDRGTRWILQRSARQRPSWNWCRPCFGKILKTEGPGGFFKGALANVLRGTGAALVLV